MPSLKDKITKKSKQEEPQPETHKGVSLDDDDENPHDDDGFNYKDNKHSHIFNLFKLPTDEKYVARFRCSLDKVVTHAGNMYITTTKLLFYSKFPTEEMIQIKLVNITSLQKKKTAGIIPNALKITTREKNEYTFSNFIRRDHVLETIESQSKLAEGVENQRRDASRKKTMEKAVGDGLLVKNMNAFRSGEDTAKEITDSLDSETMRSGKCYCVIL
eukprot:TRINITY_DN15650_c0_g1_i1.p1 TRINITY_DN15650_c0_g1~~TRINITY_DN15650_c0_g1_i1.p1  ORF type:complete len:216 (-),score=58.83 TRINITY_DN15650_c0_g1_i1:8-655(-)